MKKPVRIWNPDRFQKWIISMLSQPILIAKKMTMTTIPIRQVMVA
jgi:hypothetical protein